MRRMRKSCAVLLGILLLLPLLILPVQAVVRTDQGTVVRVGLYFGSNALPTANLANEAGSGFFFGYFDDGAQFHYLGETDYEKITTCKDETLFLSGGSFYETPTVAAYTTIGAYHVQLEYLFQTYTDALIVAQQVSDGFPAWVGDGYAVRYGSFSSYDSALSACSPGQTVVGCSSTCYTVVATQTGQILFEFDDGGTYFAIQPRETQSGSPRTWFKGYQYYGSFQYARRSGWDLSVINYVELEQYVAGVIPYELSASWPLEALKSGAVCARTFCLAAANHKSLGFDVCNTTCCQVYRGAYTDINADNVTQAVSETQGVCAYYDGEPIETVYCSGSGGFTESAKNTWVGDLPYLQAKVDEFDSAFPYPCDSWSYRLSPSDVTTMLQNLGYSCSTIVSVGVTERTEVGNVMEVSFVDSNGKTITLRKDSVRLFKNIPQVAFISRCFEIVPIEDGENSFGTVSTTVAEEEIRYSVFDGQHVSEAEKVCVLTENGLVDLSGSVSCITSEGVQVIGGKPHSTVSDGLGSSSAGWMLNGHGNGHNVGLSQYGAYAMAKLGYTYRDILTYYYTGIDVY